MERVRTPGPAIPPYEPLMDGLDMEGKTRSTVVTVESPQVPPPRDHLAWSLCTTLYANVCCLGFLALVFSVKSRDRKVLGDYSGALSYGSTAKYLNITAHLINIFLIILVIALVASGTIVVANIVNHHQQHPEFIGPT
ncbi:dispanin subfamily A member 2b-like [Tympanuchus pallidicinctus]|uniref:dispanin subfamily A member 2b-like n=1 Tax=Tympanuchus pallidicinctus TaxID=109042 RepID=UPI0022874FC1|nr:dispanin subfamily A member 2b-like [Tympanuchus pallidicinctus]